MGLTAKANGGGNFKPAPEGTHVARCIRVIDLGTQPGSQQYPTPRHKVLFVWELPDETVEIEGEQKPALVTKRYTMSLHENAALRHDLQSWRGRAFTDAELEGFELKKVLGAPCMITIVHSADGQYANITAVTACPKSVQAPEAQSPLVYYEIEDGESAAFGGFSDKLQEAIRKAPEWPGSHDPGHNAPSGGEWADDDIPF